VRRGAASPGRGPAAGLGDRPGTRNRARAFAADHRALLPRR
jgi:hypothetical protein